MVNDSRCPARKDGGHMSSGVEWGRSRSVCRLCHQQIRVILSRAQPSPRWVTDEYLILEEP